MNGDNPPEPIIADWPGGWPGRQWVDLDHVGDPGDWLSCQISDTAEVLFEAPNDEGIAAQLADAYIAAAHEEFIPLPTEFGATEEEMYEIFTAEFVGFLEEWRRRSIAKRERLQNPVPHDDEH